MSHDGGATGPLRAGSEVIVRWLLIGALVAVGACTTVNTGTGTVCLGHVVDGICVVGDGADAAAGDVESHAGNPCTTNLQCGTLACIGGYCSVQCNTDKDCPGEQVCKKLVCEDPGGSAGTVDAGGGGDGAGAGDSGRGGRGGGSDASPAGDAPLADGATGPKKCGQHLDCAPDGACVGGFCVHECDDDWECGAEPGWQCVTFQCLFADPPVEDTGAGPDVAPTPDVSAPPPDTGKPPTKSGYGVPCGSKEECESGLCVQNAATGQGTCTQLCGAPSDCPGKDTCIPVQQGTSICYPSDSGKACPAAPGACAAGFSLTDGKGACTCAVECEISADCQSGAACSTWQVVGGTKRLCTPIGLSCKLVANKPKGDVCHQLCYPLTQTGGVCSAQCTTSLDCPPGWTCFAEALPDGTVLKTCQTLP